MPSLWTCCLSLPPVSMQGEEEDLKSVVSSLRAIYGVDYIYCWHGLPAYWSGISIEDPGEHHSVLFGIVMLAHRTVTAGCKRRLEQTAD